MAEKKENVNNTFIGFLINKQSILYLAKFWSIVILSFFMIIITFVLLITPFNTFQKPTSEKLASNLAANLVMEIWDYHSYEKAIDFIGNKSNRTKHIYISKKDSFQIPEEFNCIILDSVVIVTHKDGTKGEANWR